MSIRGAHPDVLRFCREELLADNYFHAVLEAVKSVGEKIRNKTGLTDDGGTLIDRALGGTPPMLAINGLLLQILTATGARRIAWHYCVNHTRYGHARAFS